MKTIFHPLIVLCAILLFQSCTHEECPEGEEDLSQDVHLFIQNLADKDSPPLAIISEENVGTNDNMFICGLSNPTFIIRWLDQGETNAETDDEITSLPIKTLKNGIFVSRFNKFGVHQNTKLIGVYFDECEIRTIEKMHQSGYVIIGNFKGKMQLGGQVKNASARTGFIARFDTNGNMTWYREAPANGNLSIMKGFITSNAVYAVGQFRGNAKFAPYQTFLIDPLTNTLTNTHVTSTIELNTENNFKDGFLAKYDLEGNVKWVRQIKSAKMNELLDVEVWNDDIFVTGYAEGDIQLPYTEVDTITLTAPNGTTQIIVKPKEKFLSAQSSARNCIIANYDLDGEPIWAKTYGGDGLDEGVGICVSASNELFVAGNFNSSAMVVPTESGEETLNNRGVADVFRMYAEMSNGNVLRIDGLGGKEMDNCTGVYQNRLDKNGSEYMHGIFSDTFWINHSDFLFDRNNGHDLQSGFVIENKKARKFGRSYFVTNGFFSTGMTQRNHAIASDAQSGGSNQDLVFVFGNHLQRCSQFMNRQNDLMMSFNQDNEEWKSVLWRIRRMNDVDTSGDPDPVVVE